MTCKNSQQVGPSNPLNSAIEEADYSGAYGSGAVTISNITCDSTVSVGDVVYVNGSTVEKAQANTYQKSLSIGIVTAKSSSTLCDVTTDGPINILSGLDTSKQYFLSETTAGALVTIPPTTSGNYVITIGKAASTTIFIIRIQRIVRRT